MTDDKTQKHFVFIIGTRAQLIKVAPIIAECEKNNLECTLLMTGQHLETMQDLLDEFGIKSKQIPATAAQEHATVLSLIAWLPKAYIGVLKKLKALPIQTDKVDVLVHGDTLSTVLGALAGRKFGARVVHLESGLTSKKTFDPFPEEILRRIVFRLSHIAMCPNQITLAHMQLKYPKCKAINTGGNTILDAIKLTGIHREHHESVQPYIVASLHRFQNIYDKKRFSNIIGLLVKTSQTHTVKFVLHPATRKRLTKLGLLERLQRYDNIELIPRLGYSAFLKLAAESAGVLTDGGSNQEELAALGIPTIIMRQATERIDGLGINAIMEHDIPNGLPEFIKNNIQNLETKNPKQKEESPSSNIVSYLLKS